MGTHVSWHGCGSQRTAYSNQFSPSTQRAAGIGNTGCEAWQQLPSSPEPSARTLYGLCHHLVVNQYLTVYSGRWYLTRVPAFERESQENQKLKTSLGSYLKKIKNRTKFQFVVAFLPKLNRKLRDVGAAIPPSRHQPLQSLLVYGISS